MEKSRLAHMGQITSSRGGHANVMTFTRYRDIESAGHDSSPLLTLSAFFIIASSPRVTTDFFFFKLKICQTNWISDNVLS